MAKIEKKISLGRDANGKLVRRNVRGNTKAEVERKAFEMRQKWLEKAAAPNRGMTFITFARHWFNTAKALRSINTRAMYSNVIEKHLEPAFHDLYFDEITLTDLQLMINRKAGSPETCKKIKLTLSQIYAAALEEGYPANVNISKLVLPVVQKKEKRALTEEEKNALFEAKDLTDEQRAFVLTLYYTGLRREEALALVPSAFDFKKKTVTVSQTLVYDKGAPVIVRTAKSSASLRSIFLPDKYIEAVYGYVRGCSGLIFPMPSQPDRPMSQSSYTKFWQGIQRGLLPYAPTASELTAHIFRHNYATQLYYSGITVKMAAKLMGHSNTNMIMRIYAHLDEERELPAEKLNQIFSSKNGMSPSCPHENEENQ